MSAEGEVCHMVTMIICFVVCFLLPLIANIKDKNVLYGLAIFICSIYFFTLCTVLFCVCNSDCLPRKNEEEQDENSEDTLPDTTEISVEIIIINPSNEMKIGLECV